MATHTARYDGIAITFHWLTALLIAVLYALGQLRDLPGRGSALSHWMLNTHYSLGLALAAVIVLRLAWRATHRPPAQERGLMGAAAHAGHVALYGLVIATVVFGITSRWFSGQAIPFFGFFTVPPLMDLGSAVRHSLRSLHELAANGVMILAGLHAAAALLHHYVLRDEVLHRMLPFGLHLRRSRRISRFVAAARRALRAMRPA